MKQNMTISNVSDATAEAWLLTWGATLVLPGGRITAEPSEVLVHLDNKRAPRRFKTGTGAIAFLRKVAKGGAS
jgi:hypothetical protein